MKNTILKSLSGIVIFFTMASCSCNKEEDSVSKEKSSVQAAQYICPMNCENGKTYDKDGQCPVCGMDLDEK